MGRLHRRGILAVTKIHGVDFSGAVDAGRRIWLSTGEAEGARLHISRTRPASELPGGGTDRESALAALVEFIRGESGSAIGLDFPFGLPDAVVPEPSWKEFVLAFAGRYPSAEAFRETCRTRSKRELRRASDREARAPWAAWNWRLYRQTFFGIGSVLAPLVAGDRVRVLPLDLPDGSRPLLLEICPASTLRRLGLSRRPYKNGPSLDSRAAREAILGRLMEGGDLGIDPTSWKRAAEDPGGDALDSVVAAWTVWDTVVGERLQADGDDFRREGFIYV